ncbi:MAG: hypothetical protein HXY34_13340 [Candidatus Thorarchaeota archaeon]|nr:hypothetical protein [Candidatus Thorarchaeota archaeon]
MEDSIIGSKFSPDSERGFMTMQDEETGKCPLTASDTLLEPSLAARHMIHLARILETY